MEISFLDKFSESFSVILLVDGKSIIHNENLSKELKNITSKYVNSVSFKSKNYKPEEFSYLSNKNEFQKIHFCKITGDEDLYELEAFAGRKFSELEKNKNLNISLLLEEYSFKNFSYEDALASIASGFNLKNYSFRKYRSNARPIHNSISKINIYAKNFKLVENKFKKFKHISQGVFLTRDLVSEPANILYPEKFVSICKKLSKAGIKLEVFDEKKIKSLGMNALIGVAQGSVRPPRVLIMKWNGTKKKINKPLAFVGKGVTFDTGGISIKPSGGMEDMKWDMGGAGVVAGLMYSLGLRKSKVDAIGIVGLVENMPDGNAQRPGDIVESMSGQTIEVLNTDAEGRLVLADILWYINQTYKPKLIVDLATLTGAIIVALGDRYGGLFSNSDSLSSQLLDTSKEINELLWRLPLDNEFDKLLNCDVADMKNITGTRGAGSITAAQFLKRFIGNTNWAHLDIAGVTWSKKGTALSRSGGTGFGVRLLDKFVEKYYEN